MNGTIVMAPSQRGHTQELTAMPTTSTTDRFAPKSKADRFTAISVATGQKNRRSANRHHCRRRRFCSSVYGMGAPMSA